MQKGVDGLGEFIDELGLPPAKLTQRFGRLVNQDRLSYNGLPRLVCPVLYSYGLMRKQIP